MLPNVPAAEDVLAAIAAAGYGGTELGPPGYLGNRSTLRERLARNGLALAGGFVPIRLTEPDRWGDDLTALATTLDLFDVADGAAARPVLADAGSRAPLDEPGWRRLVEGLARAADLARRRGYEPTFHPHAGSHVEAPAEIERLLESTDVGLVLDTGHLALGGGDPVSAVREWRDRIDHVHVKDYSRTILESVAADRADMAEAWRRGVFVELGTGDVDLDGLFRALDATRYSGWLVVEQDRIPRPGEEPAEAFEAQRRNRHWLAQHAGL